MVMSLLQTLPESRRTVENSSRRRAPGGVAIGVTIGFLLVLLAARRVYHRSVPKLIFLCSRSAGLTHEQYAAHLLGRHAPLALRHHATLRRYVLNVVEETIGGSEPIDSVNALEYETLADFELRNYDSPAGERIVTEDHARFLGAASGYLTHESVYRPAPTVGATGARSPGVKWICALQRKARLSAEQFASRLETEVVPALLAGQPGAAQVVVDRVERKLYDAGADWDAFLETRFADSARGPLQAFDSFECAIWRVAEYVERA
jgi:hypothetical protein